jgi:hypothetical protein
MLRGRKKGRTVLFGRGIYQRMAISDRGRKNMWYKPFRYYKMLFRNIQAM